MISCVCFTYTLNLHSNSTDLAEVYLVHSLSQLVLTLRITRRGRKIGVEIVRAVTFWLDSVHRLSLSPSPSLTQSTLPSFFSIFLPSEQMQAEIIEGCVVALNTHINPETRGEMVPMTMPYITTCPAVLSLGRERAET